MFGLFILLLVGITLHSEGGHLANLTLFGDKITQISKTTYYLVLFILVINDIVQSRYQEKLSLSKDKLLNK